MIVQANYKTKLVIGDVLIVSSYWSAESEIRFCSIKFLLFWVWDGSALNCVRFESDSDSKKIILLTLDRVAD